VFLLKKLNNLIRIIERKGESYNVKLVKIRRKSIANIKRVGGVLFFC
jgi:hypothetical protein